MNRRNFIAAMTTVPLIAACAGKAQDDFRVAGDKSWASPVEPLVQFPPPEWEPTCPTCFSRDAEQMGDEEIWACELGHVFVKPRKGKGDAQLWR